MARISKTSLISGVTRTLHLSQYEQDDFENRYLAWREGKVLIQDAFPDISPDAREFIMTGITPAEWESTFGGTD